MSEHHTQTKQRLRQLLQTGGRVATTATLTKRGLLSAANALVATVGPERQLGFSMGLMQTAVLAGGAGGPAAHR